MGICARVYRSSQVNATDGLHLILARRPNYPATRRSKRETVGGIAIGHDGALVTDLQAELSVAVLEPLVRWRDYVAENGE